MHDTVLTTTTSRRLSSEFVVEWRRRSTSALIELSFSMNVSDCGTYASGW